MYYYENPFTTFEVIGSGKWQVAGRSVLPVKEQKSSLLLTWFALKVALVEFPSF
jgi:hypothetical protein